MSQKNRNTLEVPLPRNMREADELGYIPQAGCWTDIETQFISDNEMILTALCDDFAHEEGADHLPMIKARFTAHFSFEPIQPAETYEKWEARRRRRLALEGKDDDASDRL